MRRSRHIIKHIKDAVASFAIVFLAATHHGCRDEGETEVNVPVNYDIVEVASVDAGQTVLNLWRPDADSPVVLTCHGSNPISNSAKHIRPGMCVLAGYSYTDGRVPYQSGAVSIHSFSYINNIKARKINTGASVTNWDADPVELWSIWRGGTRIFMRLSLPYTEEPRFFSMVIDPATESDPVPTLLLWHERATHSPTFDRRYFAACDIATLWKDDAVEGVKVRVANSLNPSQCEFIFMKQ